MKKRISILIIALFFLIIGVSAQTTIASMTTIYPEGEIINITVAWNGSGSITANGTTLTNNKDDIETGWYSSDQVPVPANSKIELIAIGTTELFFLSCSDNQLTSLDVTKCTGLKTLTCLNNRLTNLDITKCTGLTALDCQNNCLTSLDITLCTALKEMYANYQNIVLPLDATEPGTFTIPNPVKFNGNKVTNISLNRGDVSAVGDIEYPFSGDTDYISIGFNVTLPVGISGEGFSGSVFRPWISTSAPKPTTIAQFTTTASLIDISATWSGGGCVTANGIPFFPSYGSFVDVPSDGIIILGSIDDAQLTNLSCSNNQIKTIDLTKCTELNTLYCYNNQLKSLDVTNCKELEYLECSGNQLEALDLNEHPKLKNVHCYNNRLKSLDLFGCTELYYIDARMQQIEVTLPSGTTGFNNPVYYRSTSGIEKIEIDGAFYAQGERIEIGKDTKSVEFTSTEINASSFPFSGTISIKRETSDLPAVETEPITICTTKENIIIEGAEKGKTIQVYDVSGVKVATATTTGDAVSIVVPDGLYIVRIGEFAKKVIKKSS